MALCPTLTGYRNLGSHPIPVFTIPHKPGRVYTITSELVRAVNETYSNQGASAQSTVYRYYHRTRLLKEPAAVACSKQYLPHYVATFKRVAKVSLWSVNGASQPSM